VISLDMGLVAGTRFRGEFEERLKVMDEIRSAGNIILMIDEVHTLIGTGVEGGMDAANILKPALARVNYSAWEPPRWMNTVSASSEMQPLESAASNIMVGEPTVEETIEILGCAIATSSTKVKFLMLKQPPSSDRASQIGSA